MSGSKNKYYYNMTKKTRDTKQKKKKQPLRRGEEYTKKR